MKTNIMNKLTELGLFLFLILFLFSYSAIDVRHTCINVIVILLLCFIFFIKRYKIITVETWKVFLSIMFIYIFDFIEKINFIQQFGLPVEIVHRIPLSTIVLSILFLVYLVKYLINKNCNLPNHPFIKYLFIISFFLLFMILIFYPILYAQYQMGLKNDLLFLNKIAKYLIIILLITNYIDSGEKVKKLSISLILSLGLNAVISLVIIILNIK
jgi:hypothetical protein